MNPAIPPWNSSSGNINSNDTCIINFLFQKYFTKLKLTKHIDINYFKTLANFIIYNSFIMHDSKIYSQVVDIAQGVCSR